MQRDNRDTLLYAAAGAGLLLGAVALLRRRPGYSFTGRTVLITGGSRGLGLVLAREFTREGARVVICARDAHELDRAARDLQAYGRRPITVACDVTDRRQVENLIAETVRATGRLDVLINNAGTIQVGPWDTMTAEDYEASLDIHFRAPLYTTLAAIPHLKRAGAGRIANIASIGGLISVPHLVPYSTGKFALVGFSRGMRSELAKEGITVTTICPGLMRTGSPRNAMFKGQHRAEYAWFNISDSQPLTSISAERAARQITDAIRRGDAELIITTQAKIAAKLDALFPEFSSAALSVANCLLPDSGGMGTGAVPGYASESAATRTPLTALGDAAARRNNEM